MWSSAISRVNSVMRSSCRVTGERPERTTESEGAPSIVVRRSESRIICKSGLDRRIVSRRSLVARMRLELPSTRPLPLLPVAGVVLERVVVIDDHSGDEVPFPAAGIHEPTLRGDDRRRSLDRPRRCASCPDSRSRKSASRCANTLNSVDGPSTLISGIEPLALPDRGAGAGADCLCAICCIDAAGRIRRELGLRPVRTRQRTGSVSPSSSAISSLMRAARLAGAG